MASDNDASCVCDPNFAVVCSFLEKFGKPCGIIYPGFSELQEMLENTLEAAPILIDLHIKLLRKARKSVHNDRWERALVKFCHTYSNQDGWEIERFGYKKARVTVKLRALKNLLEEQFDSNLKFKGEVNRLSAKELRLEPLGRDRKGYAYWCQMDDQCNLRIYREDLDEETWKLVAKSREGLVHLISELSSNETATGSLDSALNEDSNSLSIEKPIIDTGQEECNGVDSTVEENSVKSDTKPHSIENKISDDKSNVDSLVDDNKNNKVIIKMKSDIFDTSKPTITPNTEEKEIPEDCVKTSSKTKDDDSKDQISLENDIKLENQTRNKLEDNFDSKNENNTEKIHKSPSEDKSDNESKNLEDNFEKSDDTLEKSEITENSETTSRISKDISKKSEEVSRKSKELTKESDDTSKKPSEVLKKPNETSKKSENVSKESEDGLKISKDIVNQSENDQVPQIVSKKFEEEIEDTDKTTAPFKISVRKDLIVTSPKNTDSDQIDQKTNTKVIPVTIQKTESEKISSNTKILEPSTTIEPVKKSIRIKTVPKKAVPLTKPLEPIQKKVIEINTSKPLEQSILKKLSTETLLDQSILKRLSNLENIKIDMAKPSLISNSEKEMKEIRKKIPSNITISPANISISPANISITPQPPKSSVKKLMNSENPFSSISRYKGTQENIRGLEDLIENIYSNVGVDLSNKSSYPNPAQEIDGLDLSKTSQRSEIQKFEIDLSTKKSKDTNISSFQGLPLNLEKTVSLKRGVNTLDDEYVVAKKKKKPDEYSSDDSISDEEVGEEIEEPVMLVQGEGSGKECEGVPDVIEDNLTDSFWCSEVIEEPIVLIFGSGSGKECDAVNTGKEESENGEKSTKNIEKSSSSNSDVNVDNNRDKTESLNLLDKKDAENPEDGDIFIQENLESSEKVSIGTSSNSSIVEKPIAPLPATKRFLQSVSIDADENVKSVSAVHCSDKKLLEEETTSMAIVNTIDSDTTKKSPECALSPQKLSRWDVKTKEDSKENVISEDKCDEKIDLSPTKNVVCSLEAKKPTFFFGPGSLLNKPPDLKKSKEDDAKAMIDDIDATIDEIDATIDLMKCDFSQSLNKDKTDHSHEKRDQLLNKDCVESVDDFLNQSEKKDISLKEDCLLAQNDENIKTYPQLIQDNRKNDAASSTEQLLLSSGNAGIDEKLQECSKLAEDLLQSSENEEIISKDIQSGDELTKDCLSSTENNENAKESVPLKILSSEESTKQNVLDEKPLLKIEKVKINMDQNLIELEKSSIEKAKVNETDVKTGEKNNLDYSDENIKNECIGINQSKVESTESIELKNDKAPKETTEQLEDVRKESKVDILKDIERSVENIDDEKNNDSTTERSVNSEKNNENELKHVDRIENVDGKQKSEEVLTKKSGIICEENVTTIVKNQDEIMVDTKKYSETKTCANLAREVKIEKPSCIVDELKVEKKETEKLSGKTETTEIVKSKKDSDVSKLEKNIIVDNIEKSKEIVKLCVDKNKSENKIENLVNKEDNLDCCSEIEDNSSKSGGKLIKEKLDVKLKISPAIKSNDSASKLDEVKTVAEACILNNILKDECKKASQSHDLRNDDKNKPSDSMRKLGGTSTKLDSTENTVDAQSTSLATSTELNRYVNQSVLPKKDNVELEDISDRSSNIQNDIVLPKKKFKVDQSLALNVTAEVVLDSHQGENMTDLIVDDKKVPISNLDNVPTEKLSPKLENKIDSQAVKIITPECFAEISTDDLKTNTDTAELKLEKVLEMPSTLEEIKNIKEAKSSSVALKDVPLDFLPDKKYLTEPSSYSEQKDKPVETFKRNQKLKIDIISEEKNLDVVKNVSGTDTILDKQISKIDTVLETLNTAKSKDSETSLDIKKALDTVAENTAGKDISTVSNVIKVPDHESVLEVKKETISQVDTVSDTAKCLKDENKPQLKDMHTKNIQHEKKSKLEKNMETQQNLTEFQSVNKSEPKKPELLKKPEKKVDCTTEVTSMKESESAKEHISTKKSNVINKLDFSNKLQPTKEPDSLKEIEPTEKCIRLKELKPMGESSNSKKQPDSMKKAECVNKPELIKELKPAKESECEKDIGLTIKLKSAKEPELVKQPVSLTKLESVKEPKLIKELEAVKESEIVKKLETTTKLSAVKEMEVIKKTDVIKKPEAIKKLGAIKESETVQELEAVKESEATKEPEAAKDPVPTKESESVKKLQHINAPCTKESEPIKNLECTREPKSIIEPEYIQKLELVKESDPIKKLDSANKFDSRRVSEHVKKIEPTRELELTKEPDHTNKLEPVKAGKLVSIKKPKLAKDVEPVKESKPKKELEPGKEQDPIKKSKSAMESELSKEPELNKNSEDVKELEPVKRPEPIKKSASTSATESESKKEPQPLKNLEIVAELDSLKEALFEEKNEFTVNDSAVKKHQLVQKVESENKSEHMKNSESVKAFETMEASELIKESEIVKKTKAVNEIETAAEPKPAIELVQESAMKSELVVEPKLVMESEPLIELELAMDMEPVKNLAPVIDSEPVKQPDLIVKSESLKEHNIESKCRMESEPIKELCTMRDVKLINEPELLKAESVQKLELTQVSQQVQKSESMQDIEPLQKVKCLKGSKIVKETEHLKGSLALEKELESEKGRNEMKEVAGSSKEAKPEKVADLKKSLEQDKVTDLKKGPEKSSKSEKELEQKKVFESKAPKSKAISELKKVVELKKEAEPKKKAESTKIVEMTKISKPFREDEPEKVADSMKMTESKKVAETKKLIKPEKLTDCETRVDKLNTPSKPKNASESKNIIEPEKSIESQNEIALEKVPELKKVHIQQKMIQPGERTDDLVNIAESNKAANPLKMAKSLEAIESKRMTEAKKTAKSKKLTELEKNTEIQKKLELEKEAEVLEVIESKKTLKPLEAAESNKVIGLHTVVKPHKSAEPHKSIESQKAAEPQKDVELQKVVDHNKTAELKKVTKIQKATKLEKSCESKKESELKTVPEQMTESKKTAIPLIDVKSKKAAEPLKCAKFKKAADLEKNLEIQKELEPENVSEPKKAVKPLEVAESKKAAVEKALQSGKPVEPEKSAMLNKSDESENSDKSKKSDKLNKTTEPDKSDKTNKSTESDKSAELGKSPEPDKSAELDKSTKSDKSAMPDKSVELDTSAQPDKSTKLGKSIESGKSAKPDKSAESEKVFKPKNILESKNRTEPENKTESKQITVAQNVLKSEEVKETTNVTQEEKKIEPEQMFKQQKITESDNKIKKSSKELKNILEEENTNKASVDELHSISIKNSEEDNISEDGNTDNEGFYCEAGNISDDNSSEVEQIGDDSKNKNISAAEDSDQPKSVKRSKNTIVEMEKDSQSEIVPKTKKLKLSQKKISETKEEVIEIKKVLRTRRLEVSKTQESKLPETEVKIKKGSKVTKRNTKTKKDVEQEKKVEDVVEKCLDVNKEIEVDKPHEEIKDLQNKETSKVVKSKGKRSKKSRMAKKGKQIKNDKKEEETVIDEVSVEEKVDEETESVKSLVLRRPLLMCVDINKLKAHPQSSSKHDSKGSVEVKQVDCSTPPRTSVDDSVIELDTDSSDVELVDNPSTSVDDETSLDKEVIVIENIIERTTRSRVQRGNTVVTMPSIETRRKRSLETPESAESGEIGGGKKRRVQKNKRSNDVDLAQKQMGDSIQGEDCKETENANLESPKDSVPKLNIIVKEPVNQSSSITGKTTAAVERSSRTLRSRGAPTVIAPVVISTKTKKEKSGSPISLQKSPTPVLTQKSSVPVLPQKSSAPVPQEKSSASTIPQKSMVPVLSQKSLTPIPPQTSDTQDPLEKSSKIPPTKSLKAEPKKRKSRQSDIDTNLILQDTINEKQESSAPVRQSRRIAQIKIKEEAERRKIEEFTLAEMKHEQKKKKKMSEDDKVFKFSDNKKKKVNKVVVVVEDESTNDSVEKKRKKKKKKRHKGLKFDEANPWKSSSESSSSNEEEEEEEEPEVEEQSEEEILFKSDHEFSPESDLEENAEVQPLRRARTAKVESDADVDDDYACQQCGKSDHPEWILLCDSCDCGWHCSCLRPALLVIPEGDWFCPPCQHITLVARLKLQLQEFDKLEKHLESEEMQKQRNEYVGISASNILPGKEHERRHRGGSERSDESGTDDSGSSGSDSDSSDSEPIYQLRQRRQANSYLFSEYDNLIKSAIQDEMDAVKSAAGNQGRGKDIRNIVDAEKNESESQQTINIVENENAETPEIIQKVVDGEVKDEQNKTEISIEAQDNTEASVTQKAGPHESSDEDIPPVVIKKKQFTKKKHISLTNLDITSEEDNQDSDEDFKGSSSDDDEDEYEEGGSDESDDYNYSRGKRKGSLRNDGPVRRSTRARTTRYDQDFINDDSDDDAPRKKKSRSIWDESESEDSDKSWGKRRRTKRQAFPSFPKRKKSKSKKKRRTELDSDSETVRPVKVKKPRIKYGGLSDIEEDDNQARRTRGRKINYLETLGTDSEEEALKSTVKPLPESEEDEYVANEEEDEDDDEFEPAINPGNEEDGQHNTKSENINVSNKIEFQVGQESNRVESNLNSDVNLCIEPMFSNLNPESKSESGEIKQYTQLESNAGQNRGLNLEQLRGQQFEQSSEMAQNFGTNFELGSQMNLESKIDSESKLESVLRSELIPTFVSEHKFEYGSKNMLNENPMNYESSGMVQMPEFQPFTPVGMPNTSINLKTGRRPRRARTPRGSRGPRGSSLSRQSRGPSTRGRGRGSRGGRMGFMARSRMMNMLPNEGENSDILEKSETGIPDGEDDLEEGEISKGILNEMGQIDSDLEEDMDEEEIAELMMEEEEFANKQLERAAAQIAREKKRKEREEKREEKLKKRQERIEKKMQKEKEKEQKEYIRRQKEEERQRLREQLGEHAVKEPKKRGRKKKSEIEAAAAAMALAQGVPMSSMSGMMMPTSSDLMMTPPSETGASALSGENSVAASTDSYDPDISLPLSSDSKSDTPVLPKLVVRTNLFNPPPEGFGQSSNSSSISGMGMGMNMDMSQSPPKRRGRGSHLHPAAPMQTSPIGMLSQGSPIPKASTPSDTPLQGGKLGIVAPPQPFTQTQPTPSVITRMLQSQPMSSTQNFAHKYFGGAQTPSGNSAISPPVSISGPSTSGLPPSVSPGLPPSSDTSMRGPPPGPFPIIGPRGRIPSPYRQGPHGIPSPHYTPGSTPPPHVRLPVSSANVAPLFHTGHHPLDPSPSGGGPIAIGGQSRDQNSPAFTPPSATSPLTNKGTPPPPPYSRPSPLGRFSGDAPPPIMAGPSGAVPPSAVGVPPVSAGAPIAGPAQVVPPPGSIGPPIRHHIPFPQQGIQQSSPPPRLPGNFSSYPQPPPSYHYGGYPPPPSMTAAEDALPPPAYQGSPYPDHYTPENPSISQPVSDSSNSKPFEEDSGGEFGGLVSYFSSQREDDLDS